MAPMYKLTYFDIKGLGECIKYILQYRKIEYECETIKLFSESWYKIKPTFPFAQLPVLEIKGKKLYQSLAICQYLGNVHDLKIGDSMEDALLLALGGSMLDFIHRVANFFYSEEPDLKAKIKQEVEINDVPFYLDRFEKNLKAKGDYFGGRLTWVDFYIVASLETINGMLDADLITDEYPCLKKHMKRIWNLPGIKDYIATRPPYKR